MKTKFLQPSVPSDFCKVAYEEALDLICKRNLLDFNMVIFISSDDSIKEVRAISGDVKVEVVKHMPTSSWMILDRQERFLFYNKGA